MALFKPYRRILKRIYRGTRRVIAQKTPKFAKPYLGPVFDYIDMLFFDHGIFRVVFLNKHKIADGVYRSSQPAPHQIRSLSKRGIKTIVNLRGIRECGSYRLEKKYCEKYGIKLVNFQMYSRAAPAPETIRNAEELFANIEYPILMHCKSGADRAGIASALHVLLHQKQPVEVAQKQLSLKYGHIKQADTGVLDYFFDCYIDAKKKTGIKFYDWLETVYNPDELKQAFKANGWMSFFAAKVLNRE